MDFEAVALATSTKAVREGTYTDELMASVREAWEAQLSLGEGYCLRTKKGQFKDKAERDEWLRKAQAYGKSQDLFVSKARAEETDDDVLAFTVQIESERQGRIQARKGRASLVEELTAAGYAIPRGRGATEAIKKALEDLGRKEEAVGV
jgi:hypothetical protein